MNDAFKDRENAAEARWAHDEELRFKVMVRRARLLGLWAAGEMGISSGEADTYAKEVVQADFEEASDHDIFRKIRKDFDARGVDRSDHLIQVKMAELLAVAGDQIVHETRG